MKTAVAPARIKLALLGGWQLTIDGRPAATPAYEKGRALLAYLAVENRWISRETLGGLLWPDSLSHRANLRQVLANLRAVLQDNDAANPGLLVRREAISIGAEAACQLDVAAFLAVTSRCDEAGSTRHGAPCLRRMEEAADLYRGEFLAGISLADCPGFDEWLQHKRAMLQRHAVVLHNRLADCHEQHGELASALTFAHRATELDPWDEPAQRRLMRLLAANGRRGAALRQYEMLEASLARDMGIQPEDATRKIYHSILVGDDGVSAYPESGRGTATTALPASGKNAPGLPPPDEVRRVVVLNVEPDLNDEIDPLDPELYLAPLDALLDAALARWNGRRIATTGPMLGAVFGLADDSEQAPRRALRAALEIAALPEFDHTRIGICEGKMLVCQNTATLSGNVLPALAQRLALCGEPGDIVVAEALAGELGSGARFEPLPRRRFTGLAGEHGPCRLVVSPAAKNTPYPTAFATPFVGRENEHIDLVAALETAKKENRAVFVEVSGLAGVGKSRLLAELARKCRADGSEIRWVSHRPELCHVSLGALRETILARIAAVSRPARPSDLDDLGDWLERFFPAHREALRAPLRAFLYPESDGATGISGRGLLDALITLVFSPSTRKKPVLLVFDDLHWADEATRELLQIVMRSPPAAPILAVLASRPSAGVAPPHGVAISNITLEPLAWAESLTLIAAIDQEGRIDAARQAQLAGMSGGLPLCAEYVARAARDQPVSDASLFGVLHGVLDRLGQEKQILQAAAVFGATFSGAALRALLPERGPAAALKRAEALTIICRTGKDGYAFHHALLRDCAYGSIPPKQRRTWHRQAAIWLSRRADAAPSDIARHFEEAHAWREARDFWWTAAQTAYQGEFAGNAKDAAMRALAAVNKDSAPIAKEDRAKLELLAGFSLLMIEGYGSKKSRRFFEPIAACAQGELRDDTLIRALCGMAAATPTGRDETLAIMNRLDKMARTPVHRMMVNYGFGSLLFWRGEFAGSLRNFESAMQIGETIPAREWLGYSADNPVVACRALKSINLAFSGAAADAREAAAQAVADARREGRAHGLCFALTMAASVYLVLDRPDETEHLAAEGLELAVQRHFPLWRAYNTMFGLWAKARHGRLRLGESFRLISMRGEFAAAARLSPVTALWFASCIFEAIGSWSLLDASAGRALALVESGGDRYCLPDLMRQKALARHARGDTEGARHWLARARMLSDTQGSFGLLPRLVQLSEHIALPG